MLVRCRSFTLPEFGMHFCVHDALHPRFRVRSIEFQRAVYDDLLVYPTLPYTGDGGRAVATITLAGDQRLAIPGRPARWLGEGESAIWHNADTLYRRHQGERAHSLTIEWQSGSIAPEPSRELAVSVLDGPTLALLRSKVAAFHDAGYDSVACGAATASLLTFLGGVGFPFHTAVTGPDIWDPKAEQFAKLSRAMDRTVSSSGNVSSDMEVAIARSRWQVTRTVRAMHARYGLDGANWRVHRDRGRLLHALTMLSNPVATTEAVARSLGYTGPGALYHALANANLPSPGNVPRALHDLE